MLFGQDRDQLRSIYCQAWRQHRQGQALEPLQAQIVAVVERHPEYQPLLENRDQALGRDYLPEMGETNPFLHMGLHLAIQEQIDTDRPDGIRALYQGLAGRHADTHSLDHMLMDCLAETIWQAQKNGGPPDEQGYLDCIKAIAEEG